mgnify:CR=1 FL=1
MSLNPLRPDISQAHFTGYSVIQTERCILRRFQESDLAGFMAYRNNPDWMQYQGFCCRPEVEYRQVLLSPPSPEKGIQLAICRKETGCLIGDVYLQKDGADYWIGYTISPAFARRGFGFEAVSGLLTRLKSDYPNAIKAGVVPENIPSVRLLKKLGFSFSHTEDGELIFVFSNM